MSHSSPFDGEAAARGGPYWSDGFQFSGSNDIDAVAWYDRKHGDHTQPVGMKAPNQLGIYDMSGNVWEFRGAWWGRTRSSGWLLSQLGDSLHRIETIRNDTKRYEMARNGTGLL